VTQEEARAFVRSKGWAVLCLERCGLLQQKNFWGLGPHDAARLRRLDELHGQVLDSLFEPHPEMLDDLDRIAQELERAGE
jgi:hypothetical protein